MTKEKNLITEMEKAIEKKMRKSKNVDFTKYYKFFSIGIECLLIYMFYIFIAHLLIPYFGNINFFFLILATINCIFIFISNIRG